MLGGGLTSGSDHHEAGDAKTSITRFSPGIGYFVGKGLSVGLNLDWIGSKEKTGSYESTINGFGFGPFFRGYAPTGNEKFAFYFQGGFDMTSLKEKYSSTEIKSSISEIYLRPGISFLISKHWSAELGFAGITYQTYDPNKSNEDDKETSLIVGLNTVYGVSTAALQADNGTISILYFLIPTSLGFRYSFGRKAEVPAE
jgi:hypothetical protein